VVDADGVYRKIGSAKVFTTERAAIAAIKGQGAKRVAPGDVLVLICRGPMGSGMEEVYQSPPRSSTFRGASRSRC
jgi:dihydroxyacid dehydratase/phosphogluconate dehydratase